MKATIIKPDGTTIQVEGTPEEIATAAGGGSAPLPVHGWTGPVYPLDPPKSPIPSGPWIITYDANGVQHWPPKDTP